MTYSQISSCPHCGAPIYVPTIWHGVMPPSPIYSCLCNSNGGFQQRIGTSATPLPNPKYVWPPQQKNSEKALEELFKALEKSKQDELKEAADSLKNTFEKNGLLETPPNKEKLLLSKIELLESNLKTLEKELATLKHILKSP